MSRDQNIVDAQTSVNRCVFEINRENGNPDDAYLLQELAAAIESLSNAMVCIYEKPGCNQTRPRERKKSARKSGGRK